MRAPLRGIWATDKALWIPQLQEADHQEKTLLIAWVRGDNQGEVRQAKLASSSR